MSRLLTTMAEAAALCSAAALALFIRGGVLSVVGGAVVGVMAVLLWLATLGLARDPQARAAVAARTAGTRTENFDGPPPSLWQLRILAARSTSRRSHAGIHGRWPSSAFPAGPP